MIEKRRSSLLEYFLTWILIRGFIDLVTWKYVIFGIWNFCFAMLELRAWNLERKETLCFKGQSNYSGLFCRTKRWSGGAAENDIDMQMKIVKYWIERRNVYKSCARLRNKNGNIRFGGTRHCKGSMTWLESWNISSKSVISFAYIVNCDKCFNPFHFIFLILIF